MAESGVSRKENFYFGGWDTADLAATYGTPLYVYSEEDIRSRCREARSAFMERYPGSLVVYAGKAFLTTAMCKIIESEGLGLDVVSGGELHTALAANFPMKRVFFHGNSKADEELRYAAEAEVGRIVADGPSELERIEKTAGQTGKKMNVLLRVTPGVDADTHRYILTGHAGSKFGFPLSGEVLAETVKKYMGSEFITLKGFHFHIGSQIFENRSHVMAVEILVKAMADLYSSTGFAAEELNMGGGFGVEFDPRQNSPALDSFTDAMMEALASGCKKEGLPIPGAIIEPGRWIVSEAGITLYTVQEVKHTDGITYAAVDGGMTDNPRPALYGAKYHAVVPGKMDMDLSETVTVAGKCCESGDIVIEGLKSPPLVRGDLLAVLNTGAYTFSMASSYNRLPRPAAVLVSPGRADIIAKRQTWDDMVRWDIIPEHLKQKNSWR